MNARHLVLALALTNAVLYSCVLPLWEGFDEPLHYGYVETLALAHRFPVFGRTKNHLSAEIRESLSLTPISWLLNINMGRCCTSFEQWFELPASERARREEELDSLPRALRREPSDMWNWEAQQAPLAYVVLAPLDASLKSPTLRTRILLLRLFSAVVATLLVYVALARLLRRLGVTDAFALAALACVFEAQMLWASIAHVTNDFLAVPLTLGFLCALATIGSERDDRRILLAAFVFAIGLVTKAYFFVFAPVLVGVLIYDRLRRFISWKIFFAALAIPVLIDTPWYARNVVLYHSLTGTQQSMAGIGLRQVIAAIPRIDWPSSIGSFIHWSLWTGNWSFVAFSRATIDAEAILLAAAFLLYLYLRDRRRKWELWILAACLCFALGLIYQTCATWIHTNGVSTNAEPWYAQGVIPCIWALCFAGLAVSGIAGKILGIVLLLLSAWIAELTYIAKLLPLYGGGPEAHATLRNIWRWWRSNPASNLDGVVLGPVWAVYLFLLVFTVLLVWTTVTAVVRITRY